MGPQTFWGGKVSTLRDHIRGLLETTGPTHRYFGPEFEARTAAIFRQCDGGGGGVLEGPELREAVLRILPPDQAEAVRRRSERAEAWKKRVAKELQ